MKTGKWWKIPIILIAGLYLIGQIVSSITNEMEAAADTCEGLAPSIIELTEEDKNPLTPVILKIYDIETTQDPKRELSCTGVAKLSRGKDTKIKFYVWKDKDGDYFHGYEPL